MTADIRDYGAAGGSIDDTAAVTAAIATGDTVLVPDGIYSVSNLHMSIPGQVLQGTGTLKLNTSAVSDHILYLSGNNQQVTGIGMDGSGFASTWPIQVQSGLGQTISSVRFTNYGLTGIYIINPTHLSIDSNSFVSSGNGILTISGSTCDYVSVTNNVINGLGGSGDPINFNTPTGLAQHITITGNKCSNYRSSGSSALGICLAHVATALISGNVVTNMDTNGIHVEDRTTDVVISGNLIQHIGDTGIVVGGLNTARVLIVGNIVEDAAQNSSAGIAVVGGDPVTSVSIIGNVVVTSDLLKGIQPEWGAINYGNAVVVSNPTAWGVNSSGVFVYPTEWITSANQSTYLTGGLPNSFGYAYLGARLAFAVKPPSTGLNY